MRIPDHHDMTLRKVSDQVPLLRKLYELTAQQIDGTLASGSSILASRIVTEDSIVIAKTIDKTTGWFVQLVKPRSAGTSPQPPMIMSVGKLSAQEHHTETGSVFNFWL